MQSIYKHNLKEIHWLQPVDLSLPRLKELGARWMVEMSQYLAENPQNNIIASGFINDGIAGALDSHMDSEEEHQGGNTESMNSDNCESDDDDDGDELDF